MSILVGDIGGTSSRFALAEPGDSPALLSYTRVLSNAAHAGVAEAIRAYLDEIGGAVTCAVLAIAGPVTGEELKLTNLDWSFSPRSLSAAFGFDTIVINDFEALACALPHLVSAALQPLGPGAMRDDRSKAVLGPGTGLGVAGLVRHAGGWVPVPSEAGHVELAATTVSEFAALDVIRRELGRVSAEHVLSGPGLERLHRARAEAEGFACEPSVRAPEIANRALDRGDPRCLATVRLFLELLARFAGDVALMFAAEGGVYLHGGVAQKLAPLLDPVAFRAAFEAKAPHERWVREIPTALITEPAPALVGCAAVAQERGR